MMIDRVSEETGSPWMPQMRFLSDPDHAVIERYGLLNQEDPRDRPIPHPTTLLIDREGVVRWKFIEINYRIRPTVEDILGAIDALEAGVDESM